MESERWFAQAVQHHDNPMGMLYYAQMLLSNGKYRLHLNGLANTALQPPTAKTPNAQKHLRILPLSWTMRAYNQ
jgi:hypothetical protein